MNKRVASLAVAAVLGFVPPADAARGEVIDEAIRSVGREIQLLPDGGPGGTAEGRAALLEVDRKGAALLSVLLSEGQSVTPAIRDTLGLLPGPGSRGVVPPVEVYRQAIADLEQMRTDAPVGAKEDSTPWWPVGAVAGAAVAVALIGGLAWRRRRAAHRDLYGLAFTDGLTGLMNRRRLDDDLVRLQHQARKPVMAMMIDVDHFKQFNDDFGHTLGDELLRRVGTALSGCLRSGDAVYRYGGEEFCVLLDSCTVQEAEIVGERIRSAVRAIDLGLDRVVTVSIGFAEAPPREAAVAVERADRALYRAKHDGRDRAVQWRQAEDGAPRT